MDCITTCVSSIKYLCITNLFIILSTLSKWFGNNSVSELDSNVIYFNCSFGRSNIYVLLSSSCFYMKFSFSVTYVRFT